MKKVLSLILALTLAFALSVPVLAVDPQSVVISTSVDSTYTVTIPVGPVNLTWGNETNNLGDVTLATARLEPGGKVRVTTNGTGTLKNGLDNTKTIAYSVKSGANAFTTVEFDELNEKVTLTIAITTDAWAAAVAGSYSDTITFTSTYISPTT